MNSLLFTLFYFILALAILITVHEFGHFWVARKLGVKVLRFSIGFGKPLVRYVSPKDATEYVVASIPLGGYVKMLDEREAPVPEALQAQAFNRQSLPVRSAIVVAGPLFNFLFAVLAFWFIFVTGDTGLKPLIGEIERASLAQQSGFTAGDEILSIDETPTPTWENVIYVMLAKALEQDSLNVRVFNQDSGERNIRLPSQTLPKMADEGLLLTNLGITPKRPELPAVIEEVTDGEPADQAGLMPGDRIVRVEGKAIQHWAEWVGYVKEHPDQLLELEIDRGGDYQKLNITPKGVDGDDGERYGRIGAGVEISEELIKEYQAIVRYGPVEAVGHALTKTWDLSVLMLKMLGKMLIGEISFKSLGGPLSIADSAGKSASYGIDYFIKFLAMVSVSLGVLNMLPIPILDGGHLFYFLIEAIQGHPVSEQIMEKGQRIGLLILLAVMSLALYVDFNRYLG
jgi:regulator of sigma E protease